MGGGGSNYIGRTSDIEKLKGIARERIIAAGRKGSVSIFIPHSWSYEDEYNRLIQLLEEDETFAFNDYSVPRDEPLDADSKKQLREALMNQIRPVSVVLIPAGMYAAYSESIQMEIEIAKELNKPIIAIYPWGSQMMPQVVSEAADEIVGWNKNSIIEAIDRVRDQNAE